MAQWTVKQVADKARETREAYHKELVIYADVQLHAGESIRTVCPVCGGGSKNERSLNITKKEDGTIKWFCFRASCHAKGIRSPGGTVRTDEHAVPAAPKTPKPYSRPLLDLSQDQLAYFKETYGLSTDLAGEIRFAPEFAEGGRYAFEVLDPSDSRRGYVFRSHTGAAPKSINYREDASGPFIGWYTAYAQLGGPTIIVEDALSAMKVSLAGYRSVALNGTHVNNDIADEIEEYSERVILALDKGTFEKMLTYQRNFDIIWGESKIWRLEKDLKYEPIHRIRAAVIDGKTDFRAPAASGSDAIKESV